MKTQLSLAPIETLAMAQCIRHLIPTWVGPCVLREFLYDFGLLYTHHINSGGELNTEADTGELSLDEETILVLREQIPASIMFGRTPVGIMLHRKLYEALLRLHPEVATEVPVSDVEEKDYSGELKELKLRKGRGRYGRSQPDHNTEGSATGRP